LDPRRQKIRQEGGDRQKRNKAERDRKEGIPGTKLPDGRDVSYTNRLEL